MLSKIKTRVIDADTAVLQYQANYNEFQSRDKYYLLLIGQADALIRMSESCKEVIISEKEKMKSSWYELSKLLDDWKDKIVELQGMESVKKDLDSLEEWIDTQEKIFLSDSISESFEDIETALQDHVEFEQNLIIQDEKVQQACLKCDTFYQKAKRVEHIMTDEMLEHDDRLGETVASSRTKHKREMELSENSVLPLHVKKLDSRENVGERVSEFHMATSAPSNSASKAVEEYQGDPSFKLLNSSKYEGKVSPTAFTYEINETISKNVYVPRPVTPNHKGAISIVNTEESSKATKLDKRDKSLLPLFNSKLHDGKRLVGLLKKSKPGNVRSVGKRVVFDNHEISDGCGNVDRIYKLNDEVPRSKKLRKSSQNQDVYSNDKLYEIQVQSSSNIDEINYVFDSDFQFEDSDEFPAPPLDFLEYAVDSKLHYIIGKFVFIFKQFNNLGLVTQKWQT